MKQSAFSLVELSIVLVILGLLVGGILAGQSLIRASELRSLTAQSDKVLVALNGFRDKYFALPGDMPNAVRFWNAQAGASTDGVDATCAALTTGSTGTATCNGNGDGQITTSATINVGYEAYRAWQHLANAGLIEGTYSGVSASTSTRDSAIGVNIPATKIANAGLLLRFSGTLVSTVNQFDGVYLNVLQVGAEEASGLMLAPFLTPSETWNIDTKTDDGKPGQGRIRTYRPAHTPNCAIDADNYALSIADKTCAYQITTGY